MRNRNPHFFCVQSELGAGTRGASLGPQALQIQASNIGSKVFIDRPITEYHPGHQPLYHDTDTPHALRVDAILPRWQHIAKTMQGIAQGEDFPVVLTGDHSSAGAVLSGIKMAYPDKRLGAIWIDAHLDLHTPYTSPSGNMHGMPLGAALGLTSTELNKHEISQHEADQWKQMVELGDIRPKLLPEDLVFHGIRSYERPEWALVQQLGLTYYTVDDLRQQSAAALAQATFESLSQCDLIYISFDVDSLDAKVAPGTGTPEANGYTAQEAEDLLKALTKSEKLVALEFTELNPLLESPKTTTAVFDILNHTLTA